MGKTVAQLQEEMTSREFAEWMAYNRVDPIGNIRGDLQSGIIASTIYNINRGKGKVLSASDFMPDFSKPKPTLLEKFMQLLSIAKPAKDTK